MMLVMLIPLTLLPLLQLPRAQKALLLFVFLTPLFAIIFAILNLVFDSVKTFGPTINPIRLLLYSTLEVSLCEFEPSLQFDHVFTVLRALLMDQCLNSHYYSLLTITSFVLQGAADIFQY